MNARPERWFNLSIPEEKIRRMNRAEYYAAMSYLRRVARTIHMKMEQE